MFHLAEFLILKVFKYKFVFLFSHIKIKSLGHEVINKSGICKYFDVNCINISILV